MTGVIEKMRLFALSPRETVERLVRQRSYTVAFLGYLTAVISVYGWDQIAEPESVTLTGLLLVLALLFFWYVIKNFIYAALVHASLSFMGARGSEAGLFILMGFTEITSILLIPLGLIAAAAGIKGIALNGLFYMGLIVFQYYVLARLISMAYSTTMGRAWIALLSPIALFLGLVVVLTLGIIGLVVAGIMSLL